ncbi:MAG: ATP-grasp domain-containing protein [Gemmataceae bacterium]|nr:ATP-grasp domain-containing protein [Gemmataceae bacterium]
MSELNLKEKLPGDFRVTIIYNQPVLPEEHEDYYSELEILETVEVIEENLIKSGLVSEKIPLEIDLAPFIQRLNSNPPHVVLNLFEGFGDFTETEIYLAGLLEWKKIPYTGSSPGPLFIGRDKLLCKQVLSFHGIPTPKFFQVESLPVAKHDLAWPRMVKPASTDASIGIDQGSVVTNQKELEARVQYVLEKYGSPVLVEEFLDGREFTVALAGYPEAKAMSPSEIHFHIRDKGLWPIISYDAKWKPDSVEFDGTPFEYPAKMDPALNAEVQQLALRAFHAVGLRDYGRIDLRTNKEGKPFVIEVNPNSDLHIEAGLAISLDSLGETYPGFLRKLVLGAWNRGKSRH